ncbi:MAG: sel1 repeat family protein [Gammaproteobacteria bacterium]|uniref:Sel1 repeat family protein n=1 Tax=Candidatus Thiopontia autotrophica TaxID=2841688 RepID=A0A8J6TT30_9GAMM|nr:sel1 repeat family protein [Candidatus Thiopontia autotrophica]
MTNKITRGFLFTMFAAMQLLSPQAFSEELPNDAMSFMDMLRGGDEQGAFELLSKRAMLGDASSQSNLGVLYQRGIGTDVDLEKAFILFELAAKQESAYGIFNLAEMYELGQFVEQDLLKALTLYELSMGAPDSDRKVVVAAMAAIVRIQEVQSPVTRDDRLDEDDLHQMGLTIM